MEIKLSNKDYIWSYIGIIVSAGSYLIMTPFVLHFLSSDMYGLWGVFQSVSAITLLFDFGFSTTFARNINYCWSGATQLKKKGVIFSENKDPNFVLMKKTITACKLIFLVISIIALILMFTIGTFYIYYICKDQISLLQPMVAWFFYMAAIFLSLYYGYYNSFLRGVGAISSVNKVTAVSRIIQMLLTIVFLFCGLGIIGTGIAYLIYGVLFRMYGKSSFYKYKGIGKSLESVNENATKKEIINIFKIIWFNARKEGLVTLSNYLANQACTIICSIFLPLSVTGVYSLSVQASTAVSNISGALYTANQPVLQASYITGNREKTKDTMSLIVVSFILIYIVGTIAVVTVGLPILKFIKPNIALTSYILLGTGVYQFILKFRNCYTSYFSCTNRIPYVKPFIIASINCVVLSLILLKKSSLGIWGLILAQIFSQTFFNFWYWPLKAHKEMNLSLREMFFRGVCSLKELFINIFMKEH